MCSMTATAQAPPRAPGNDLINATAQLDAQQEKLLADFVAFHVGRLAGQDPKQVSESRNALIQPLRSNPSVVFLFHYSKTLVPALEQVIDKPDQPGQSNAFAVTNAMLVLQSLKSKRALDAVVRRIGDPRVHVRIVTGSALETLLSPAALAAAEIQPRDVEQAVTRIQQTIATEENGVVMLHLLRALATINTTAARTAHVEAMQEVAKRLAAQQKNHAGIMEAMRAAALYWRDQYPTLPPAEQRAIAPVLAPTMGSLCDVARAHWDDAHNDARAKEAYGGTVQLCEAVLILIKAGQAPKTTLRHWWDQSDKPKYEADLQLWMDLLSKRP
jgi:hypothetical protein